MLLNIKMSRPPFIEKFDNVGNWNVEQLITDLKNLVTAADCDWNEWHRYNKITNTKFSNDPLHQGEKSGNINLTCNLNASKRLDERLWNFSGRRFQESMNIDHADLHTLNPELRGTYTEELYKKLVEQLGPVYVRIHNKADFGLYWHRDINYRYNPGNFRYHIPLWTNPGHFLVWTPDDMPWEKGVEPIHKTTTYQILAQYLPSTGDCYKLATGYYVHGVSAIGIGHASTTEVTSRCHIVVVPIKPNNRYDTYVPL
jgi:hypothetical protein